MSNLQIRLKRARQLLNCKDEKYHIIIINTCAGMESICIDGEEIPIKGNVEDSLNEQLKSREINPNSLKVILIKISGYLGRV